MYERRDLLKTHKSGIDKFLKGRKDKPQVRGLFLGTGESGKSTIFKQMRLFYGSNFSDYERLHYAKVIWGECLRAMRVLVDRIDTSVRLCPDTATNISLRQYASLIQSLDLSYQALMLNSTDENSRQFVGSHLQSREPRKKAPSKYRFIGLLEELYNDKAPSEGLIPDPLLMFPVRDGDYDFVPDRPTVAFALHELWIKSPALRHFSASGKSGVDANMPFFFERVLKFADPDYLPNDEEILHARIKTTGIISSIFKIKSNLFEVIDIGGQRTERNKWIHCFDDATCVLYVVSVADYYVTLDEGSGPVNALLESLRIFQKTVSNEYLSGKPIALFLNKMDVLEQNLRLHPFDHYFPSYDGTSRNAQNVSVFIENMFRKSVSLPSSSIYVYRTCATDRNAMKFVVEAVTNMIFIENLKWAGMM